MNSIDKIYASKFLLKRVTSQNTISFYDEEDLVSFIDKNKPNIFKYKEQNLWKLCKTSELYNAILNNIKLHG